MCAARLATHLTTPVCPVACTQTIILQVVCSHLSWRLLSILNCSTFLAVISSIRQSASFSLLLLFFPLASLLSSLYWPCDSLSSLESTPVSISVPKQVDCNMCRFSKPLLFSFLFCKDGSDRLMKLASYSCCNFICVVPAAVYLKYRRCRLSCLPFVWHFFSLWHTHTYFFSLCTCPGTHCHP